MIHQRRVAMITLSMAIALAAACKKAAPPPVVVPPPVTPTVNQDSIDRVNRQRQLAADSARLANEARQRRQREIDDSTARANQMAADAARAMEAMRATLTTVVNYDYDKAELRADTKQALDAKIPILNANPAVTIRVSGHTDSRGSGEYNLQLGQRRAAAARDYLVARGVAASRVELVSYGEERPLCQTMDEACWTQNRRAEFEITAGGNMLKRP